jgi:hypothetical protein
LLLILGGRRGLLLILRCHNKRTAEEQQRAAGQQQDCRFAEGTLAAASASDNAVSSVMHLSPPSSFVGNPANNLSGYPAAVKSHRSLWLFFPWIEVCNSIGGRRLL